MSASRAAPLLAVAVVLAAASARAEGVADLPLRPSDTAGARLSTTMTASPQSRAVETLALVPALGVAWRPAERWTLSTDAAFALTSARAGSFAPRSETARAANPIVGLRVVALATDRLKLDVGAAAGAPLVTVPGGITKNAAAEHADRAATAAAGQRVYWMWARNVAPIVALGRLEYTVEELVVRVDLEPGLLLSVNRDPSSVALLAAVEARIDLGRLSPGARFTSLFTSRERDTRDFSQSTAAGFVRWDGDAFFGAVEAVTGIDPPQGLVAQDQTSWGVTLAVGTRR